MLFLPCPTTSPHKIPLVFLVLTWDILEGELSNLSEVIFQEKKRLDRVVLILKLLKLKLMISALCAPFDQHWIAIINELFHLFHINNLTCCQNSDFNDSLAPWGKISLFAFVCFY